MFGNVVTAAIPLLRDPLRYEGEQSAADHDMYGINSPTESKPAPQLSQGELGIADRLNWDMDYTTQSGYTPTEYVRPWEVEGWGSGDVKTTPPTRLQTAQEQVDAQPILPQRPGFRPGQRDYEYMPTEKEQRRERAANIATIARERGTRWQDIPLPGGGPAPEPTYGRWQDAKLPGGDEVRIQPVPAPRRDREWGESRPGEAYIQIEGPGNPSWERRNPKEVTIQPIEKNPGWSSSGKYGGRPATSGQDFTGGPTLYSQDDIFAGRVPNEFASTQPVPAPRRRRERAFDVRDTWRTPRSGRGISTSSTRNLGDRGIMTDRMRYYRR